MHFVSRETGGSRQVHALGIQISSRIAAWRIIVSLLPATDKHIICISTVRSVSNFVNIRTYLRTTVWSGEAMQRGTLLYRRRTKSLTGGKIKLESRGYLQFYRKSYSVALKLKHRGLRTDGRTWMLSWYSGYPTSTRWKTKIAVQRNISIIDWLCIIRYPLKAITFDLLFSDEICE